jgi:hypothetical protein
MRVISGTRIENVSTKSKRGEQITMEVDGVGILAFYI